MQHGCHGDMAAALTALRKDGAASALTYPAVAGFGATNRTRPRSSTASLWCAGWRCNRAHLPYKSCYPWRCTAARSSPTAAADSGGTSSAIACSAASTCARV